MEERKALERQIELLQNLINQHKSIHGDAPFPGVGNRGPEASTSGRGQVHTSSSRGGLYAPHSRGSWRQTYSLKNKPAQPPERHPTASTSSVPQTTSQSVKHSTSLPQGKKSDPVKTATLSSGVTQQVKERLLTNPVESTGASAKEGRLVISQEKRHGYTKEDKIGINTQNKQSQDVQVGPENRRVVLPVKKESSEASSSVKTSSTSSQSSSHIRIKPSLTSKAITAKMTATTKNTTVVKSKTPPNVSLPFRISTQTSSNSSSQFYTQPGAYSLKKSKFTWVKSGIESKQSISTPSRTSKALSVATSSATKSGVSTASPFSFQAGKKTPGKKSVRKLSHAQTVQKTSKYKWVSSAGAQPKMSRKYLSPRASSTPQRSAEKRDIAKKHKTGSTPSPKLKKGPAGLSTGSPSVSRYRWKAGEQSTSTAVVGGSMVARRKSAFHWTAERSNRGTKGGLLSPPTIPLRGSLPSSSPSGFKLRSRMKIIRKSPGSHGVGGSDRGFSAVKYSQRGRGISATRSPAGVRRTPTRELVSFGRHKLRRHSPSFSKTNPSFASAHTSPASQRVFRTRYKMVTCPNSSTIHYNPALTWRAKRIQSARSFLQSRLRVPQDRHPPSAHHWRGDSVRWIRGSLYQVSANKLSRTAAANMSINRTGRFSSLQLSPTTHRPSSTRHLASRAVQRSLAIIRHARQKKQPKQFCMYYNRFGKCNRGSSCPFIHDPDKVAVCTRFLRGTCKQADGTCPFSHKVAKEKMPVCSYFLKGICNNSDCPYSHVYVSRKAEVCKDFVNGYCPEGEKCKKKHTLVCPDFQKSGSCPRGSRCNLQHHRKVKRSSSSPAPPAKRACIKELVKRPHLALAMPQDSQAAPQTPKSSSLALPSFISLSSSPEEADAPDTLPADTSQVKEKKLQIKPRL